MSKQSEAKAAQRYSPKGRPCRNCVFFACDSTERPPGHSWGKPTVRLTNLRCAIGLFAVKQTATCDKWSPEPTQAD